jgi:prepilin-type N-terminal cleavage/methylation domain-containing protein
MRRRATNSEQRAAFTIIELLIVLAIIGTLIALLLPAVQRVRDAAYRTVSMNNLRQISLGSTNFAENHGGQFPGLSGWVPDHLFESFFVAIMPYVEQGSLYEELTEGPSPSDHHAVKLYLNPADPTASLDSTAVTSYAANAQVFIDGPRLENAFPDGTSNTIGFAEHYARCGIASFSWFRPVPVLPIPTDWLRRATFADNGPLVLSLNPYNASAYQDAYPVTSGDPPFSVGSVRGLTFQVRPAITECDPRLAQTPHAGGMLVALLDGSVRTLTQGMSETTYWAAVTPDKGESLGPDW